MNRQTRVFWWNTVSFSESPQNNFLSSFKAYQNYWESLKNELSFSFSREHNTLCSYETNSCKMFGKLPSQHYVKIFRPLCCLFNSVTVIFLPKNAAWIQRQPLLLFRLFELVINVLGRELIISPSFFSGIVTIIRFSKCQKTVKSSWISTQNKKKFVTWCKAGFMLCLFYKPLLESIVWTRVRIFTFNETVTEQRNERKMWDICVNCVTSMKRESIVCKYKSGRQNLM